MASQADSAPTEQEKIVHSLEWNRDFLVRGEWAVGTRVRVIRYGPTGQDIPILFVSGRSVSLAVIALVSGTMAVTEGLRRRELETWIPM